MTASTSATGGFIQQTSTAPIEDDGLADALQSIVVGITGLDGTMVRPRWQERPPKQPEPSVDWCGIGVMSQTPDDNISLMHTAAGDGSSTSYEYLTLHIMATFYGPNAGGNAAALRSGLMIAQNREALFALNMALVGKPGPSTINSELVNTRYISRSDLTFEVRRKIVRTWAIENALSAQVTVLGDDNTSQAFTVTSEE